MFNDRISISVFVFLFLLGLSTIFVTAEASRAIDTTLVSISSSRRQGNGFVQSPKMSAYGRFIAFRSGADNLVPNDTNDRPDILVHDRWTGDTSRVGIGTSGEELERGSHSGDLSGDGRFVAFNSQKSVSALLLDDIYIHDRFSRTTEMITSASAELTGFYSPQLSYDGRYVVYVRNIDEVYIHDRQSGHIELISVNNAGVAANGYCWDPAVSADGNVVAYKSWATNLVTGYNSQHNIFIRDIPVGKTYAVSKNIYGSEPNGTSERPALSGDGRFIAFESDADDLVPNDTNMKDDVFVYDRVTGVTTRVSVNSSGQQGDESSSNPSISRDGNFVAFSSYSTNLVSGVSGSQIYIRDRNAGKTYLVSANNKAEPANNGCYTPKISATGSEVVYESYATNLFHPDVNNAEDVFTSGTNQRFARPDGTDAGSCENPGSPCRTIQYAVNASRNGDVIKLARGTYSSGFTLLGSRESVHLEGGWKPDFSSRERDASLTVIDYHSSRTVVWCSTTSKRLTLKLSGLTVRHGYDSGDRGGGITLTNLGGFLELVLENVRIVDNQSQKGGGLVADTGGSGALTRIHLLGTQVLDNRATLSGGGGVYVRTSAGAKTEMFVKNSVLAGNYGVLSGGALEVVGDGFSLLEILNSTIMANTASQHGGGIHSAGVVQIWVSNSIVWGNDQVNSFPGEDIWLAAPSYVHTAFSDLGNVVNGSVPPGTYADGGNNFSIDPGVRDSENRNFHLKGGSPAIGKGLCGSWFLDLGSGRWLYSREAPYFDLDDQCRPEFPPIGGGIYHLGCDVGADELLMVFPPIYLLLLP